MRLAMARFRYGAAELLRDGAPVWLNGRTGVVVFRGDADAFEFDPMAAARRGVLCALPVINGSQSWARSDFAAVNLMALLSRFSTTLSQPRRIPEEL